ncbi:hypothetical protein [uncultured Maribacter sp.]|uniref:hypothetical protein n=1 Tax=uncultured Maribacter sp. TaxID=431308 RepID=UPI00260565C0|nr:hypothetical protein [uncultured Maribacter sp.]
MDKAYKAVALKQTDESGSNSYTFIIKGRNVEEALTNAQNHIKYDHKADASYHIELKLLPV